MKKCNNCDITKPLTDYWFSGHRRKDGSRAYRHVCKECHKQQSSSNTRKRVLKSYGITTQEYEKARVKQNNCCLLCGKHETTQRYGKLVVDHCHATGDYRGLLCSSCNFGLGSFYDNIEVLEKAIKYVKENRIRHRD